VVCDAESGGVVRVSRRLLHGESAQGFVHWVQRRAAVARSLGSMSVEVQLREEPQRLYTGETTSVRFCSEPWTSNPFDPMVDRARDALVAAGIPPVLRRWQLRQLGMGTAGGYLVRNGIQTVGFGPGDEAQAHACDESIELDSLIQATYATAVLAHAFIGGSALKM
jgi:acetylornithine deacetylase/succinyl-diaminopimelate desuccinylase-like protein